MGDDEQPAVESSGPPTTPQTEQDQTTWTGPRHRSSRGVRPRRNRPSPEAIDEPSVANDPGGDPPEPEQTKPEPIKREPVKREPIASGPAESHGVAEPQGPRESSGPVKSTVEPEPHAWLDQDAGPVVRPYTLTGGRSRPFTSGLNLLTHVEALYAPDADLVALQPEQRAILGFTRTATSLAEIAARVDLPVGVVRVLVGDLIQANLVSTFEADAAIRAPDDDILQAVIDGLRAL
jgi:Protein of unknown function (DUF742)